MVGFTCRGRPEPVFTWALNLLTSPLSSLFSSDAADCILFIAAEAGCVPAASSPSLHCRAPLSLSLSVNGLPQTKR